MCLEILDADRPRLLNVQNYLDGRHKLPFIPVGSTSEYKDIAQRSITNWMPTVVSAPSQLMYVDGFRRSTVDPGAKLTELPEMIHWQDSRLDHRQTPVHRAAVAYGHSFAVTRRIGATSSRTVGLSPLRTAAFYQDPIMDLDPTMAVHVTYWSDSANEPSRGVAWDATDEYEFSFKSFDKVTISKSSKHGFTSCPVTRFIATLDLDGRALGVVEPLIPSQDRVNQNVFDLMIAASFSTFVVRTATGVAPPSKREWDAQAGVWRVVLDDAGNPVPDKALLDMTRILYAEDPNAKFSSLAGTPLDGFISSAELGVQHLAALSQTPPHFLLGKMANISAEALRAAETALIRKVSEYQHSFGESWERVFRLAAEAAGDPVAATDMFGEVVWRDVDAAALAETADALGKFATMLGVPVRGLWSRIPGATSTEIESWSEMWSEENTDGLSAWERNATERALNAPGRAQDAIVDTLE